MHRDAGLGEVLAGQGVYGTTIKSGSVGSNSTHTHTISFSTIGSHSHNITLNLKYVNLLICIKN